MNMDFINDHVVVAVVIFIIFKKIILYYTFVSQRLVKIFYILSDIKKNYKFVVENSKVCLTGL